MRIDDRIARLERDAPHRAVLPDFESREAEIAFEDDLIATLRRELADLPATLTPALRRIRDEAEFSIRIILARRAAEWTESMTEDMKYEP